MSAGANVGPEEVSPDPRGRWTRLGLIAVVVLVATVGGYLLGSMRASSTPGDRSVEAGFTRDMVVHHGQAVEMAEIVRDRTNDEAIRILATDIALTQQAQIGRFQGWLDAWGLPARGIDEAMAWMGHPTPGAMPGMASADDVASLMGLDPAEMDVRFLQLMIPHHQAAILMADEVLTQTDRPEVLTLAEGISSAQQAEIEYMQDLLRQRGAEETEPPVTMPSMDG
ncbi:MAG: DUF305 domain-containing protein [Actinomycetota bacterium]